MHRQAAKTGPDIEHTHAGFPKSISSWLQRVGIGEHLLVSPSRCRKTTLTESEPRCSYRREKVRLEIEGCVYYLRKRSTFCRRVALRVTELAPLVRTFSSLR